jgi:hypothetical protein
MTKIAQAQPAASRSGAAAMRTRVPVHVLAVRPSEPADVYDLTVEEDHEFYANGVVVSNCMDAMRYALVSRFAGLDKRLVME